jgi:2-C-methyl-D-erythritol 4-phosphate cytidylyltransferase
MSLVFQDCSRCFCDKNQEFPMQIAVILPAAGQSKRFNAQAGLNKSKLELDLAGKPVFMAALDPFLKHPLICQCIIAVDPDNVDAFKLKWGDALGFHGVTVVPGGKIERWETIKNALAAVSDKATHIAVHDAARPLVSVELINRAFEAAKDYAAVIPGVTCSATLKRTAALDDAEDKAKVDPLDAILGSAGKIQVSVRKVCQTVDRKDIVLVQTPQVFERKLLEKAYAAIDDGTADTKQITDDAGLVEAMGQTVYVVEGEQINLKITEPADYALAQIIANSRKETTAASLAQKRLFAHDDE